jgi:hypothetical protein
MPVFDEALRFCADLEGMTEPEEILLAVDAISKRGGFSFFCCWRIIPRHLNWRQNETIFFHPAATWGEEYLKQYRAQKMQHSSSPLERYCRKHGKRAFTLMQALRDLTGQPRWEFDVLRSYGVHDGLCCPSRPWILLFSSPNVEPKPDVWAMVDMAGAAALDRIDELSRTFH